MDKFIYYYVILTTVAFGLSCYGPKIDTECQMVTIISATKNREVGEPDWRTMVMFPDSTVRWRYGNWGERGDKLCARKYEAAGWQ